MGLLTKIKSEMSAWVHLLVGIAVGGLGMLMVARSPVAGTSMLLIMEGLVIWSYFKTKKRIEANDPKKSEQRKPR